MSSLESDIFQMNQQFTCSFWIDLLIFKVRPFEQLQYRCLMHVYKKRTTCMYVQFYIQITKSKNKSNNSTRASTNGTGVERQKHKQQPDARHIMLTLICRVLAILKLFAFEKSISSRYTYVCMYVIVLFLINSQK